MHYIIDGYNLLFRIRYNGEDLHKERQSIIQEFTRIIGLLEIDATIVFDAAYQLGDSTRSHIHNVEIVYTSEGESADDYIVQEIRTSPTPRQETVVTSDKTLAWRSRRKGAKTETIEEFTSWLHQRYKNKLKQKKKEKVVQKQDLKLAQPIARKASPTETKPSKKATIEECLDYYQNIFEAEYEKVKEPEKPKPKELNSIKPTYKKTVRPKKSEEESQLDEMNRWLTIFEKKLKE